jgi:hypothetical protein
MGAVVFQVRWGVGVLGGGSGGGGVPRGGRKALRGECKARPQSQQTLQGGGGQQDVHLGICRLMFGSQHGRKHLCLC